MKNFASALLVGAVLFVFVGLVSAQATRTWISGVGDDANPCSRTAPCKTFAGSIAKTATGGEINCLDPGGFGGVTITKAITFDCGLNGYTGGSVLVAAGNGININAPAGAAVTIRNLSVNGVGGAGATGINFIQGGVLRIENVKVFGFNTACLNVATNGYTQVTVENTTLQECGPNGASFTTSTGFVSADLHNVRIWNLGTNGILASSSSRVFIRDSDISYATNGINQTGASPGSSVFVHNSNLSFNNTALVSASNSNIAASKCTFFFNALVFGAGNISTTGDNVAVLNSINGTATTLPLI